MKNVLFLLMILAGSSPLVRGQTPSAFDQLPPGRQKEIRQKIKRMPIDDKLLSFTLLPDTLHTDKSQVAGWVRTGPGSSSGTFPGLRVFNLQSTKSLFDYPFPGYATRKAAGKPLPVWLANVFGADLLVDITGNRALFYGLDSTGIYLHATAYHHWDSLFKAIANHDFIFSSVPVPELAGQINTRKLTRPQKKLLDDKLRNLYAATGSPPERAITTPDQQQVRQWQRQTFRQSIDQSMASGILPVTNLAEQTLCSFSFLPTTFRHFNLALNNYTRVPVYTPQNNTAADLQRLGAYDLVLVPITGLTTGQKEFLTNLARITKVLLIDFSAAGHSPDYPGNIAAINICENNQLTQTLAAETIFGANSKPRCNSRLTHGIPAQVGMNADTLQKIDYLIAGAIQQRAMPGCQVLIAKDGRVVWQKAYGYQTYDSLVPVTNKTRYDLASLTKVLATTQGIMYLTEHDSLNLDAPLSRYLPYLRSTNKKDITIRQVLAHQAGLYPYFPFWKKAKKELLHGRAETANPVQAGRSLWVSQAVEDSILHWAATSDLLAERLDTITREQYFYSDIGFYFLKDLIEQRTKQPLEVFLKQMLYQPLGSGLDFTPTCDYPVAEIAPTEEDSQLRHELLRGFVHDRNAALMGGVGGQAGLFGNANDIAVLLQMHLHGGCYGGQRYFRATTISEFTSRHYANNRRGLGWDMPGTEPNGPVSELVSGQTFGHSGFTGCAIWADPKENMIFVFLSNRVYPSAENTKLIDMNLRTRIQDVVYRSLEK